MASPVMMTRLPMGHPTGKPRQTRADMTWSLGDDRAGGGSQPRTAMTLNSKLDGPLRVMCRLIAASWAGCAILSTLSFCFASSQQQHNPGFVAVYILYLLQFYLQDDVDGSTQTLHSLIQDKTLNPRVCFNSDTFLANQYKSS